MIGHPYRADTGGFTSKDESITLCRRRSALLTTDEGDQIPREVRLQIHQYGSAVIELGSNRGTSRCLVMLLALAAFSLPGLFTSAGARDDIGSNFDVEVVDSSSAVRESAIGETAGREFRLAKELSLPGAGYAPLFQPGSSPVRGLSAFDRVFLRNKDDGFHYDIPYPFPRLIDRLEQNLGLSLNRDANRVKSALFPLGRCINRYAAAPEYFAYPRVVLAVDSENTAASESGHLFLKDQLFIGYQRKTGSMEVISYNSEAGRFEFQQISDYDGKQTPTVKTAEREICTSCHQNEGPIFPMGRWEETDYNQEVLQRIASAQSPDAGDSPRATRSQVAAIDGAINRANMFPLFQKFWRMSCSAETPGNEARCRAGLLETVLRNRLATSYRMQSPSALAMEYLVPIAGDNIKKYWPEGLELPSSDIANQNPLVVGEEAHLKSAELLKIPRPQRITWRGDNVYRIVEGLGSLISFNDIHRLDSILHSHLDATGSAAETLNGTCRMKRLDSGDQVADNDEVSGEFTFRCDWPDSALSSGFSLFANFTVKDGLIKGYPVWNRMTLEAPRFIVNLAHRGARVIEKQGLYRIEFDLFDSASRLHARTPGGRTISKVNLAWYGGFSNPSGQPKNPLIRGSADLTLLQDSGLLNKAMNTLIHWQEQGVSNALADRPFNGDRIMAALFSAMGEDDSRNPVKGRVPGVGRSENPIRIR